MKYAFYSRKNRPAAEDLRVQIKEYLDKSFIEDDENPDVIITVGGDGTFLEAVHKYIHLIDKVTFVPFMKGHVGYYIDFLPEDVSSINEIIADKAHIKEIPLIEAYIDGETYYAVNEFSLGQFAHASAYDITVDGELLESYYGSGILLSTTFGSSAYNRSVGGPIVDNNLNAIILSKIAPITARQYNSIAAPLVLSDDKIITLVYKSRHHQTLTADNRVYHFDDLPPMTVRKSKRTVKLYTKDKFDGLKRIRKAC